MVAFGSRWSAAALHGMCRDCYDGGEKGGGVKMPTITSLIEAARIEWELWIRTHHVKHVQCFLNIIRHLDCIVQVEPIPE